MCKVVLHGWGATHVMDEASLDYRLSSFIFFKFFFFLRLEKSQTIQSKMAKHFRPIFVHFVVRTAVLTLTHGAEKGQKTTVFDVLVIVSSTQSPANEGKDSTCLTERGKT
jgi:hypothetical protein